MTVLKQIEKAKKKGTKTYSLFVDLSNAYNRVDLNILKDRLIMKHIWDR